MKFGSSTKSSPSESTTGSEAPSKAMETMVLEEKATDRDDEIRRTQAITSSCTSIPKFTLDSKPKKVVEGEGKELLNKAVETMAEGQDAFNVISKRAFTALDNVRETFVQAAKESKGELKSAKIDIEATLRERAEKVKKNLKESKKDSHIAAKSISREVGSAAAEVIDIGVKQVDKVSQKMENKVVNKAENLKSETAAKVGDLNQDIGAGMHEQSLTAGGQHDTVGSVPRAGNGGITVVVEAESHIKSLPTSGIADREPVAHAPKG